MAIEQETIHAFERTDFWKWYRKTYANLKDVPDWHPYDMWECWCAALEYADEINNKNLLTYDETSCTITS